MMPSIAGQSTPFDLDAVHLEHLLEALHLPPRLGEMLLKPSLSFGSVAFSIMSGSAFRI